MATQATDRLEVVDFMPAVEKLWNDRYRLTFYCRVSDKKEDWFGDNVSTFLPAFGDLQGADFTSDGWSPRDGEEYDNMRLVEAGAPYISASGEHLVTLVYETLTDTFAQEVDDKIDATESGLRSVTRRSVAKSATEYTGEIGFTTIQHQINQETAITLYLAQVEIEDTDAYRRVTEVWLEAGVLSISKTSESEGVIGVTTQFFGVEGTTVGPVISRSTSNYEGFPVISVKTLQDVDGNSLVTGGENLVNQVSGFSPFTYPGVLDVDIDETTNSGGGDWLKVKALLTDAPTQCKVKSTTYFIFQNSSSIAASDYTYASSSGLWSPNHWAALSISSEGSFGDGLFSDSSTFRGYRTSASSQSGTLYGPIASDAQLSWQGNSVLLDATSITYNLVIDQGPPNPIGNTYTLDVKITPAFDDVDGNQYYKKTIIVTDTIPTQPDTASLPYV